MISPNESRDLLIASLRDAASGSGTAGVLEAVRALPEPERLGALGEAQRLCGPRGELFESLDSCVDVAHEAIAEALRRAGTESDATRAAQLTDAANVYSFNLAADLADCWPEDDVPRERRHFEEGARSADNCIAWRDQLEKPNDRKAMAWWARGFHQFRLGEHDDAISAMQRAVDLVGGTSAPLDATSSFDQVLYSGYLGLVRTASGPVDPARLYDGAIAAFEEQLLDESRREDAQFGIDQLRQVERTLGRRAEA